MKKFIYVLAASAVAALACTKEVVDNSPVSGKQTTISASLPNIETKLTLGAKDGTSSPCLWETGDAFALYLIDPFYDENSTAVDDAHKQSTYCGEFTLTSGAGTSNGGFSGVIPDDPISTKGVAYFPASAISSTYKADGKVGYSLASSGTGYVRVAVGSVNIPDTQDGTGMKYMKAVAYYQDGKISTFKYMTSMLRINIPETAEVSQLEVETDGGTGSTKTGLAGDLATTFNLNTHAAVPGQATTKKIVVSNGGILKDDVFITTRTIGKGSILTLTFTYKGSNTQKYKVDLSAKGTENGNIYNLGTIDPSTKVISYTTGQSVLAPKGEDPTYYFPEYGSSNTCKNFAGDTNQTETALKNEQLAAGSKPFVINGATYEFGVTKGLTRAYFYANAAKCLVQLSPGCWVKLPAVSGKKLESVSITLNDKRGGKFGICSSIDSNANNSADASVYVSGGEKQSVEASGTATFNLTGTEAGVQYFIYLPDYGEGNEKPQIQGWTLTYRQAATPAV